MIMKQEPLYSHFYWDIHIVQIQLFAKVVKCMMDDEFSVVKRAKEMSFSDLHLAI